VQVVSVIIIIIIIIIIFILIVENCLFVILVTLYQWQSVRYGNRPRLIII